MNHIENIGWPRTPDQWLTRNRILGGSSHTWFGRSVGYDEIDFERRSWVPHSGWPFDQSALGPYLERAAAHLGLAMGTGFSDASFWARTGRTRPEPVLHDSVLPCFWQFSQDHEKSWDSMRFGNHLLRQIGPNVRVILNATVVEILTNDRADLVTGVQIASPDGTRRTLHARTVVLCAGGLENPRLLLTSNRIRPRGLGNDRDQVGRYLMDHLRGNLARFTIENSERLQAHFGYYRIMGRNFLHGMRLNPRIQRDEKLLNVTAWVAGEVSSDDPWHAVKRVLRHRQFTRRDLRRIANNFRWMADGAKAYLLHEIGLPHKLDHLHLIGMCEQAPDPESRVTLSHRRDRYGTQFLVVDWRVHDQERKSLVRMAEAVADVFRQAGFPQPQMEDWVRNGDPLPKSFLDVAHPIGTTRIGTDPSTSVADVHAQVHGINGLFVAGSSTFPTSSHANPTLMIVATTIRLADELKSRLMNTATDHNAYSLEVLT